MVKRHTSYGHSHQFVNAVCVGYEYEQNGLANDAFIMELCTVFHEV